MNEFNWEGKELAYKLAQTPSTGTLIPCKEESKNWDTTENLYIEGDNLEVLKLLQKTYYGKVKMIYIDPPYNTGKDFVYHDDFKDNISNCKEIANQMTSSNPGTNDRYHTDWLNMMYPRLKLARNLLREDGVIFISIDNNEVNNLSKICDEIFGEYNKLGIISVVNNLKGRSDDKFFATSNEFLLVYAKNIDLANIKGLPMDYEYEKEYKYKDNISNYKKVGLRKTGKNSKRNDRPNMYYPIYFNIDTGEIYTEKKNHYNEVEIYPLDDNGNEGCWRWGKETFNEKKDTEIIVKLNNNNKWCVYVKMRDIINGEKRTKKVKTTWINPKYDSGNGTKLIKELFNDNIFTNPKPIEFILDILRISTDKNSLVLDFFSGSATTSQAIMKLNSEDNGNRKFILVQLPELIDEKSETYKIGYKNICEIGKERIRRAGDKIVSENKDKEGIENLDIGFKVFKLDYTDKGDDKMYNEKLISPITIEVLTNKKPKELKGKKKIATINKDKDYKVQVFVDDDYNLYYQDNHAFASCESKIVGNKVETVWDSCKCWFKIIGLYKCRNNHIVDILRDLNQYSEHLYPKNNVADNIAMSRLYEQMVNIYLDYIHKNN